MVEKRHGEEFKPGSLISRQRCSDWGCTGGAVDKRSPQSHLCDPSSIVVLVFSCGSSLLLVLALLRGFISGFSGFPPSTKINTSKFQFDQGEGRRIVIVHTVRRLLSINKVYYYYYRHVESPRPKVIESARK